MLTVNAICGIGKFANKAKKLFESFYRALFTNICLLVMELLFQYIPLMTITMLLYFARSTFYFVNGCLWWIRYIKIWWYTLNRGGGSFCDIIRDPNPNEHARPKYSHDCFRNVWMKQKYINEKWVIRTQIFNCIAKKILQVSSHIFGYYPHFWSAIFSAYSLSLFGFSVRYIFIKNRGVQTRFHARPHVSQVLTTTSRFWKILPKKYQIQKEQA